MSVIVSKLKKAIQDPAKIVLYCTKYRIFRLIPDRTYLKMVYRLRVKKKLDLENPTTFNEKLQWLKLNDRKPIYTTMVDKAAVKKYVADKIGEEYIIPTLGVWDSFDEIDFDSLPDQFVLKCTHDSGGLVIVRDKLKLDRNEVRKKLKKCLKRNYFYQWREWPYKNVKPRILAEAYMQDGDSQQLNVYKIFNFNGESKIIQMIRDDKTERETIDYFDAQWNLLDLKQNFPKSDFPAARPQTLDKMLLLAERLSRGVSSFLRTDFYEVNGRVYFSEFTFYSDSGLAIFDPPEWDRTLGNWIDLSENQKGKL